MRGAAQRRRGGSRRALRIALLAASFSVTFQNFVSIPAIPTVARDFGTGTEWATWLLTAFLLVSCIAAPLLGRLGDQFGKRRVLLLAAVVFVAGGVLATFGQSIGAVIGGRALQGVGGAMIPLSFSIVRDEFRPHEVGRAVAIQAAALPIGTTAALLLGGIVDLLSWRYLFGLSTAVGAVSTVLIVRYVPPSPTRLQARLDIRGAALLTGGLTAFLIGLTQGTAWGWTSLWILLLFLAAAVLLAAWVRVELTAAEPMVDMRMLALRPVLLTNTATFFSTGIAVTGALVLVPRLLSDGFEANTTEIGLYMLAWAFAGLATPSAGTILSRSGVKWPLVAGSASICVGLVFVTFRDTASWHVLLALVLLGFGLPLVNAAGAQVTLSVVEQTQTGVAMGMNNVSRQLGGLIGAQLCAAVIASRTIGPSSVPDGSGFPLAFGICAVAGAVATVAAMLVTSGRRPRPDADAEAAAVPAL